jgi:hypothetical protein
MSAFLCIIVIVIINITSHNPAGLTLSLPLDSPEAKSGHDGVTGCNVL